MNLIVMLVLVFFALTPKSAAEDYDYSALNISVFTEAKRTRAHFIVTNPEEKKAGKTGNNGPYYNEFGNGYGTESEVGKSETEWVDFYCSQPLAGVYKINVYGLQGSTHTLTIQNYDRKGDSDYAEFMGMIPKKGMLEYRITYSSEPGVKTKVVKIVTSDVLRQDLKAALELKTLRGQELFDQLMKRISAAERYTSIIEQKRTLLFLSQDIESQSEDKIHPQIAAILRQDIQSMLKSLSNSGSK